MSQGQHCLFLVSSVCENVEQSVYKGRTSHLWLVSAPPSCFRACCWLVRAGLCGGQKKIDRLAYVMSGHTKPSVPLGEQNYWLRYNFIFFVDKKHLKGRSREDGGFVTQRFLLSWMLSENQRLKHRRKSIVPAEPYCWQK